MVWTAPSVRKPYVKSNKNDRNNAPPHLVRGRPLVFELASRFHHDKCRAGDQVMRLEQAVDGSLGYKIPFCIREVHGQFPRRQLGIFERQLHDLLPHRVGDAVPDPAGS